MKRTVLAILMLASLPPLSARADIAETLKPFVQKHCVRCHGPETSENDLRLDLLSTEMKTAKEAETWQHVLDELNFGTMPPSDEKQPAVAELTPVIRDLTFSLDAAKKRIATSSKDVALRRLNRREYIEAIKELTDITLLPIQVPADDGKEKDFDTHGKALFMSAFQLEQYRKAAEHVLDLAIVEGNQPEVARERENFEKGMVPYVQNMLKRDRRDGNARVKEILTYPGVEDGYLLFSKGLRKIRSPRKREAGIYKVRFRCGKSRADGSFQVKLAAGIRPVGNIEIQTVPIRGTVDKPEIVEIEIEYRRSDEGKLEMYPRRRPGLMLMAVIPFNKEQPFRDHVWVDWVEISGPHYEQWPPNSHKKIFSFEQESISEDAYVKKVLRDFAYKAFRFQEPEQEYLTGLIKLYESKRKAGLDMREALKTPLAVILCSPRFLYMPENKTQSQITQRELANRLARFLWASPPDKALVDLAAAGTLTSPGVLEKQIQRMIRDPRGINLSKGFIPQWLEFERLDITPVNKSKFRNYNDSIGSSMKLETIHFLNHLLVENLSIRNLIDSDFAMTDRVMNHFYGLPTKGDDAFRRTALPQDTKRGGLLGQASFLTLTSNGQRTSPVVRGAFIMAKLMGRPSPEPPENVPMLEEPKRQTPQSLRQAVQAHVSQPQCASCHRAIDPIGFGLENFDAIGQWRGGQDTKGQLPDGSSFTDVASLKAELLKHDGSFARAFVTDLASYAFGRPVGFADRAFIDDLLKNTKGEGYRLGTIVTAIVTSDEFKLK